MMSHKLGRHQLLVMKLIVESYKSHFHKNGCVKKGEKKNFIHSLERSLEALNIHRGIKNLRKVIQNKYFRAELSRILNRQSIGIQTTFIFWNQAVPNDDSQEFIVIPENDNVPNVPKDGENVASPSDDQSLSIIEVSDDENVPKDGENVASPSDDQSLSIIEVSDDENVSNDGRDYDESFHPKRTSTLVGLEENENLDKTLSALTNISSSEVFLEIEKPLPYIPGELQETVVEDEEDEVCTNPNIKGTIFGYPNFAFNFEVEPHPSPLDRLKVPNDDFVTKRKK